MDQGCKELNKLPEDRPFAGKSPEKRTSFYICNLHAWYGRYIYGRHGSDTDNYCSLKEEKKSACKR